MRLRYLFSAALLLILADKASAQWTVVDTINNANFHTMDFISPARGCISGELQGRVRYTHDGAATRQDAQTVFNSEMFEDIQMLDEQNGYACGGSWFGTHHNLLIRTTDGGQNWNTVNADTIPGYVFANMHFSNADTGILNGDNLLYRTFDGGTTISAINIPPACVSINNLYLLTGSRIILAANTAANTHFIAISDDWGNNWTTTFSDSVLPVVSFDFYGNTGMAACSKGRVLRTTDAGQTWTNTQVASDSTGFTSVQVYNQDIAWLAGYKQYDAYLYVSKDGGSTWQQNFMVPNETFLSVSMPSLDTGYLLGYRRLYKTTNSGGLQLGIAGSPQVKQPAVLWPNPADNQVHIALPAGTRMLQASITNMSGQTVRRYDGNITTLPLSGMAKGNYLLLVKTTGGLQTLKLTVE